MCAVWAVVIPLFVFMAQSGCLIWLFNLPCRSRIAPVVGPAPIEMNEALADQCMQANIRASMEQLRANSKPILDQTTSGEMVICGAFYDLESGKVSFLS